MTDGTENSALDDDDRLMGPAETSALLLAEFSIRNSVPTLATKRVRGGGPEFMRAGAAVLYRKGRVRAWAKAFIGEPATSTGEMQARRYAVATP